jgi:SnoaL-like protein
MRKRLLLIFSVLLLAACQSAVMPVPAVSITAPTVPTLIPPTPTPSPASVAETIAQQYATASNTKNADLYLSLFSSDAVTMDYGVNYGPFRVMDIKDDVYASFASKYFQYKVTSSFVSADGRFAAFEGIYTDWIHGGNQTASAPCLVILEIRDGQIVKENIYYNGAVF